MNTGNGERLHKEFSPSRSERFISCPGSVNLLRRTPPRERTVYADEGDVAHSVLETGLSTFATKAQDAIDDSIYFAEDFAPDFKSAIQDALDYIWEVYEYVNTTYGDAQLFTEMFVNPPVTSAPGEAAGYCDAAIYTARGGKIWIMDYKHGVGVAKKALDNSQALQYGAGFLFGDGGYVDTATVNEVIISIIQPRAFHPDGPIRQASYTPATVAEYLRRLDGYIADCQKEDAPLVPGLEQCQFCEARSTCPALESRALQVINKSMSTITDVKSVNLPDPKSLDVHKLSYIKQSFPLLRLWMKGIDTHIEELLRNGVTVPGHKLVQTEARREWYIEGDEGVFAHKLAAAIGCTPEQLYHTKLKTLTEVEGMAVHAFKERVGRKRKKQAAEEAKQMFAYFTLKQSSGNTTVVDEDDPRPPVNKAVQAFQGITINPPPNQ